MTVYRLTDRKFSRLWRRNKDYSDHEIRWLARRRGLVFKEHRQVIQVLDKAGKVVANFQKDVQGEATGRGVSEKLRALASLG